MNCVDWKPIRRTRRTVGCGQQFTHVTRRLRERFGDRVTIVFKHVPLGKDCNRALERDVQPRACAAAWAAEAAIGCRPAARPLMTSGRIHR
jgi:hypothetical protein